MHYHSWPETKPSEPGMYIIVFEGDYGNGLEEVHALNYWTGKAWDKAISGMIAYSDRINKYQKAQKEV